MLNASNPGDEIWVDKGTYKPTQIAGTGTTDRDKVCISKQCKTIWWICRN